MGEYSKGDNICNVNKFNNKKNLFVYTSELSPPRNDS